jgi:hypothetical protein
MKVRENCFHAPYLPWAAGWRHLSAHTNLVQALLRQKQQPRDILSQRSEIAPPRLTHPSGTGLKEFLLSSEMVTRRFRTRVQQNTQASWESRDKGTKRVGKAIPMYLIVPQKILGLNWKWLGYNQWSCELQIAVRFYHGDHQWLLELRL